MVHRSGESRPSWGARLRHSLLARLLAGSVLVAVCSVTATAWLAVQGTSESITAEQGQTLATDTRIHDTLVGYAATHPEWDGVRATVAELAAETGRRITLTTENQRLIADSAADGTPLPARTTSVVDPLALDVTFAEEGADRIDDRAVGPFALAAADAARLREVAEAGAACVTDSYGGRETAVVVRPSGRPAIEAGDDAVDYWMLVDCDVADGLEPTDSEAEALDELNELIDSCLEPYEDVEAEYWIDPATGVGAAGTRLDDAGVAPDERRAPSAGAGEGEADVPLAPGADDDAADEESGAPGDSSGAGDGDGVPLPEPVEPGIEEQERLAEEELVEDLSDPSSPAEPPGFPDLATAGLDPEAAACVDASRREQLAPYVAPAALLYISDPETGDAGGLTLSREGALRVFGVVGLVLLLTVAVSATLSTRLVRPVHALTDAVRRMRAGEGAASVTVRDSGELGQLAAAFNEMSEHLERLERQRKAMVSDVSHELRTPLSNLRGWLEAAQDGIAELEPERMAMLVEETQLLQRIIDDLQELALADAGKLQLFREPVDAGDLAEQAAARHRLRAESAGLTLVTDVRGDIPLVADRARLLQVIGNLVGNALRHTPAPGQITVRAQRSGDEALIEVEDTGTGIAPEDLPHVFDRFWRAEKSRSRQTGGSGLGLAIVRNLVELHGGGVTVASTPGEGTVFTAWLPLDTGSADDA